MYINGHFPYEISERRRILRPILKAALHEHYRGKVSLRYNSLMINGKTYSVDDLESLPKDNDIAGKCEKEDDHTLAFFGR